MRLFSGWVRAVLVCPVERGRSWRKATAGRHTGVRYVHRVCVCLRVGRRGKSQFCPEGSRISFYGVHESRMDSWEVHVYLAIGAEKGKQGDSSRRGQRRQQRYEERNSLTSSRASATRLAEICLKCRVYVYGDAAVALASVPTPSVGPHLSSSPSQDSWVHAPESNSGRPNHKGGLRSF